MLNFNSVIKVFVNTCNSLYHFKIACTAVNKIRYQITKHRLLNTYSNKIEQYDYITFTAAVAY